MGENNDEDAEKFAILYFLHSFVLSNVEIMIIPHLHFDLVDSERYKDFPWGSLSFEDLARSLNNRLKAGGKFYLIQGMSLSIQVWLYDCCSNVPLKIASKVQSKPDIHVEKVAVSKPENHVEKEAFISKKDFDAFRDKDQVVDIEADKPSVDEERLDQSGQHFSPDQQHVDKDPVLQNMDYVGTERSSQRLSSEVDHELEANLLGKKGCIDLHSEKMNVEIDSQQLIPDELLRNINLDYLHSEKHIDVCLYYLRKKSKYGPHSTYKNEPNKSYKYSTVDCNFMNVIRSLNDVYSMDHQNLNAGGQEHHIIEYINGFRMHAAMPWHTVKDIFISVNIKEKHHWVLAVLSFSERCIFLYYSYESSGYYATVPAEIEKIAMIISLCLQDCDLYVKKGIDLQNHPRYKDKESTVMFDVLFEDDLSQQPSESLDCGVFMIMYAECLSYGHKVIATEFDPNTLRTRYAALLWDYGIRK
ncbi:hypothetical protein T459_00553 [Capsicum annuum]|uniref:Ubiquitin-like protease family profile domain-containing protein n=1 Tax=Capsicum annuum TaxID=4072 RepID=A0A2G3AEK7_CAPAN|nr:hypothetical protein T459_00553 [Capsicum annuum]